MLSVLAGSGSTIDSPTIERALQVLGGGGSVVVAGTWASGRMELARSLAAAAGSACVSTLYCDTPFVADGAAVVFESVRLLRSNEQCAEEAVKGSDWNTLTGRPADIAATISLSESRWVLDSVEN